METFFIILAIIAALIFYIFVVVPGAEKEDENKENPFVGAKWWLIWVLGTAGIILFARSCIKAFK